MLVLIGIYFIWRFQPVEGVKVITPNELKLMLEDEDKEFIDVRTPQEFNRKHIQPFKNMPVGADYTQLSKDKEIVVICQSGVRSKGVCKQLKKLGFTRVTDVKGGIARF